MTKTNKPDQKIDKIMLCAILCVTILIFVAGATQNSSYDGKLQKLAPEMGSDARNAVLNMGDSILNARIKQYNAMLGDYNMAKSELRTTAGLLGYKTADFDMNYVYPEFAEKIGATNLKEYKKYLHAYEHDSLETRMREIYTKNIRPQIIRDNVNNRGK